MFFNRYQVTVKSPTRISDASELTSECLSVASNTERHEQVLVVVPVTVCLSVNHCTRISMETAMTVSERWQAKLRSVMLQTDRTWILIVKNLFISLCICTRRHTSALSWPCVPNIYKHLLLWFKGKEQTDPVQPLNIEELQETHVDTK